MELKYIQNYRNSSFSVPPFFPYKSYDPHHQSFLVGWEACLTLFYTHSFQPLVFPFSLCLESCEKKIGRVIAVGHTYKV